jgi:hypothetical protein
MKKPLKKRTMNYIVDDLIHPQIRKHKELKALDLLLHFLIEDDPAKSLSKMLRYDIVPLVDSLVLAEGQARPRRRRRRHRHR